MADSPITGLLQRNSDIFAGRKIIIAGDIFDPMLLSLVKQSLSAYVICDNFAVFRAMAAMIGIRAETSPHSVVSYKHVKLIFSSIEDAVGHIDEADTLLEIVSKSKLQTHKILNVLKPKLTEGSFIYTAGANDGGGKSADSILKAAGPVRKIDSARKCTLFKAVLKNDFCTYKEPSNISVEVAGHTIELKQDPQVFSCGKLDSGTRMLLEALKDVNPSGGRVLDLGCGCGIVGIVLSKLGFKNIECSDVSATALKISAENASLNQVNDISPKVSDMLDDLGSYSLIAVNPPFHVGVTTTTAPTVNMIIKAKEHLESEGVMYMVANAHLGYEKYLKENFQRVEVIASSSAFVVYKAVR